jgi:DHA1 family multidrug resistance protein-like MFS transporter
MFSIQKESSISFIIRFLNSVGFYLFTPLFSLWLMTTKNLEITLLSLIFANYMFFSKGGSVIVGGFIHKYGERKSMLIGLWSCSIVLISFNVSDNVFILWLVSSVLGISISLYNVALKSYIQYVPKDQQLNAFSLLNIAVNAGAAIGPLFGGWIFDFNPSLIVYLSSLFYLLSGIMVLFLPQYSVYTIERSENKGLKEFIFKNIFTFYRQPFILFVVFSGVIWFFYIQMFSLLPLYISSIVDGKTIGGLFTIGSITVICLQGIFPRFHLIVKEKVWFSIVFYLFSISFFLLWVFKTTVVAIISMIIFGVGVVIFSPLLDANILNRRRELSPSWAFAITGLIWGLWEAIGSFVGLNLYYLFSKQVYLLLSVSSLIIGIIVIASSSTDLFDKQSIKITEVNKHD